MIKRLFKTDTLYTSLGEPLEGGMLAIDEKNRIADVGANLQADGVEVEYFEGALCPGFVNTHCHLELSHLKDKVKQATGLHGFIQELQQIRSAEEIEIENAINRADALMHENGIVAVGDISNGSATFNRKQQSPIYYHSFIELFGFDPKKANAVYERGIGLKQKAEQQSLSASVVPHSPYSVSEPLFELISKTQKNAPLSIHNQETADENELYKSGKGKMAEMLVGFGNDLSDFKVTQTNSLPSFLQHLPKDQKLLLVHNTYTSSEDIDTALTLHNNLFWCFCPKANLYIEDRLPNISEFAKRDLKCTLGTDSLASNDSLSIWEEIKTIQLHFPKIELNTLIQWATINGAEFLGIEKEYGSFKTGKIAAVNWLKGDVENGVERLM